MLHRYTGTLGIVVLTVALVVLLLSAYISTPFTISDTNPSSYIIVPLLMLPIFSFLMIKSAPKPTIDMKSIGIAGILFAVFFVLVLFLRFLLSFMFFSFAVYLLLLPLAIMTFASALFGYKNISKFKSIALYSVFASPAVMVYLLKFDSLFAQINSVIVYVLAKPFVKGLRYIYPITISTATSSIGIGQACVSLGIFLSALFFLIPIAYFYAGKLRHKVAWLASSIALLFILNIVRMAGIASYWLLYGPSQALLLIHEFIGSILFYIVLIVMLLLAGKFRLLLPRLSNNTRRRKGKTGQKVKEVYAILLVLAFSLIYFAFTLNYTRAVSIMPTLLANTTQFNVSNKEIYSGISSSLVEKGYKNFYVGTTYGMAFLIWNSSINSSDPIVLYLTRPGLGTTSQLFKNTTLKGVYYFLGSNGVSARELDVISNGSEFFVLVTKVPFPATASVSIARAYVIMPSSVVLNSNAAHCGYSALYTPVYNIFNTAAYNSTESRMLLRAYCISQRIM